MFKSVIPNVGPRPMVGWFDV